MESHSYSQIVNRILTQAMCPRCSAPLRDCAYDILSADFYRMTLELDCERCDSILTVEGQFRREQRRREHAKNLVSPETVRGVGNALREFNSGDVQELLRK